MVSIDQFGTCGGFHFCRAGKAEIARLHQEIQNQRAVQGEKEQQQRENQTNANMCRTRITKLRDQSSRMQMVRAPLCDPLRALDSS